MTNFNFDFSALPAAPVRGVEPELVGVFAALVNAAPRALGIKEIIAVAAASGIEVPAETTVRTYLNRAAEDGRIVKPTRQTYSAVGAAVEDYTAAAVGAAVEDYTAEEDSDNDDIGFDPLASL